MEHHVFDEENTGIQLKVEHISAGDYSQLLSTIFLLCIEQSLSLCSWNIKQTNEPLLAFPYM